MNNSLTFGSFRSLALDGDVDGMGKMLDAGFDVNTTNDSHETVFMHCCANNRLRSAKFLVSRGAKVNLADAGGSTATDWSSPYASGEFRDWLKSAGGRRRGAPGYSQPN
jgi:ankyrin repeat protein